MTSTGWSRPSPTPSKRRARPNPVSGGDRTGLTAHCSADAEAIAFEATNTPVVTVVLPFFRVRGGQKSESTIVRHFLLGRASMRVPVVALGLLGLLALPTFAPTQTPKAGAQSSEPSGGLTDSDLTTLLAEEFRIDISTIDVKYDYRPSRSTIEGSATLVFTMRPGQTRPLFHFDPYTRGQTVRQALQTIELNGESLDPTSSADLRRHRSSGSDQVAFEIQRDVDATQEHTLEISWSIWNWYEVRHPGRGFYMDLNDVPGRGGDMLWPTINSPEELARHRIRIRVHGDAEYTMIGSGSCRAPECQRPNVAARYRARDLERHRVLCARSRPSDSHATSSRSEVSPSRSSPIAPRPSSLGPSPSPNGRCPSSSRTSAPFPCRPCRVFLIRWGDGMEYYGATKTGIGALKHELVHMWWGILSGQPDLPRHLVRRGRHRVVARPKPLAPPAIVLRLRHRQSVKPQSTSVSTGEHTGPVHA